MQGEGIRLAVASSAALYLARADAQKRPDGCPDPTSTIAAVVTFFVFVARQGQTVRPCHE
jgi:hypothetical protein